jgi:membrane-associated phospholipid phosphatase
MMSPLDPLQQKIRAVCALYLCGLYDGHGLCCSGPQVHNYGEAPKLVHTLLRLVQSIDLNVYYFLSRAHGNWFLDRLASWQESKTLLKSVPLLSVYIYFWFYEDTDQQQRRSNILTILCGMMAGLAITRIVAMVAPFRIRPIYDSHLVQVPLSVPTPSDFLNWSSFPSDHAACLCALGFGLICLSRRLTVPITLYLAGWICLPRIYLGIHYASDVVVGAGLGIATVLLLLKSKWAHATLAHPLLVLADKKPQLFYPPAFLLTFEIATLFWDARTLVRALLRAPTTGPHHKAIASALMLSVALCIVVTAVALGIATRRSRSTRSPAPAQKSVA